MEELNKKFTNETYVDELKKTVVTVIYKDLGFGEFKKIVGKSKCAPEDIFDQEFGKKLSSTRAWLKEKEFERKELEKQVTFFTNVLNDINTQLTKVNNKINDLSNEIQELENSIEE